MSREQINPWEIKTLHDVTNEGLLENLISDMIENGWHGRPLLVIETEDNYFAWTGTHRVHAAREAGFESIPCYVLDESVLKKHGFDAVHDHVLDYERVKILRKVGDETALSLMVDEGRVF